MAKIIPSELIGKTFGQLTILDYSGTVIIHRYKDYLLKARCTCGKEKIVRYSRLILPKKPVQSCGCLQKKVTADRNRKHDLAKHPLYKVWKNMRSRCYNKKIKQYKDWGGRGITVCDEWRNNFTVFYDFAIANGWTRELTIDRTNNNENYTPSNCRFVTHLVNNNNRRNKKKSIKMGPP